MRSIRHLFTALAVATSLAAIATSAPAVLADPADYQSISCYSQWNDSTHLFGIGVGAYATWDSDNGDIAAFNSASPYVYAYAPYSWTGTSATWTYQGLTSGTATASGLAQAIIAGVIVGQQTESVSCSV